jgi:hypothetical protein
MNKKLFLLSLVLLSVPLFAQEIDTPYDFPVKPGTEKWAALRSSRQLDSVCVIPGTILSKLSDRALLITVLNYPRIVDFFFDTDLQGTFDFYSVHFNGLAELMKRSDLSHVLLGAYLNLDMRNMSISGYNPKLSKNQIGLL